MRLYVDIHNIELKDLKQLHTLAETYDGRRIVVGGDMTSWAIDDTDVANVKQVVMCKDCIWYRQGFCKRHEGLTPPENGYCNEGERDNE